MISRHSSNGRSIISGNAESLKCEARIPESGLLTDEGSWFPKLVCHRKWGPSIAHFKHAALQLFCNPFFFAHTYKNGLLQELPD